MHISLAPTFLHIIIALTWLIDMLVVGILTMMVVGVQSERRYKLLMSSPAVQDGLAVARGVREPPPGGYPMFRTAVFKVLAPLAILVIVVNIAAQILLPKMPPSIARVVLGVAVVVIFALALFATKVLQPLIYGSLEAIFATGSCGYSLSSIGEKLTPAGMIVLASSIYLMIRAMDNIKKGLDEPRKRQKENKLDEGQSSLNPTQGALTS